MNILSCKVGYIYCLKYKGVIFYIGQTKRIPICRYRQHIYSSKRGVDKLVYRYIRYLNDYNNISFKVLKACSIYSLDDFEIRYIKRCIDRKIKLYNSCVKTISYLYKDV